MIMRRLQAIGYTMGAANAIYGSYSTLAVSMYNLPGAFVTPIAISLVPILTSAAHVSDKKRERRILNSSLRLCGLITLPASLGLSIFSRPILELLFAGETNAINISAPLLSVLGIAVFFSSVMTVTNSILQAYGMERKPIISMFAGALVKTLFSYILIGVPKINIFGAPISTLLCAITVTLINLYYIKKATGELESTSRLFIKPMLAATVSIGAAGIAYYTVASIFGKSYALTLGAIALAVLLYGVCALKMKAVVSEDINLLPLGDKIEKLLRKVKLL
jgi:stage V sporulation protein B